MRRYLLALLLFLTPVAQAAEPIKIGSIFEYTKAARWGEYLDQGQDLAIKEINDAGGVLGRNLELVKRDNKMEVGETIRLAEELSAKDKVSIFTGTVADPTALALSEWARKNDKLFVVNIACTDALTGEKKNESTFKIHPPCASLGKMLAEEAAKLPARKWAYLGFISEYSKSFHGEFKRRLTELRPDTVWVSEQEYQIMKLDAGSAVNKLRQSGAEAVLDLLVTNDQLSFIRQANTTGLMKDIRVVSPNFGMIEEWEGVPAKDLPTGWITGGYPAAQLDTKEHQEFMSAFKKAYNTEPTLTALIGYITIKSIAAAIDKAGSDHPDAVKGAMAGMAVETPAGSLQFGAYNHQSNFGFWIGRSAVKDKKLVLEDWSYKDGAAYLPEAKQ